MTRSEARRRRRRLKAARRWRRRQRAASLLTLAFVCLVVGYAIAVLMGAVLEVNLPHLVAELGVIEDVIGD